MSSIVTNKVGKYTYIYESVSFRDENGKPQTKKTPIGKIDPRSGQPVYRPEYLERVHGTKRQPIISDSQVFTVDDIKQSRIVEYGVFSLLSRISEQIGLTATVKDAFSDLWESVLSLAFYIVATGEPAMYCEDWILKSESYDCGSMISNAFARLLTPRMLFSPTTPPDHMPAFTSLINPQYLACPLRNAALAASLAQ